MEDINNQIILVGSYTHSLDDKKRIIFPSVWRHLATDKNQIYLLPHPEKPCLHMYLKDEMTRRIINLRQQELDYEEQEAVRSITSTAELLTWDSQGRLRIGDHLLQHIGSINQIVLVGVLSRIEIWSEEKFNAAVPKLSDQVEGIFFNNY